MIFVLDNHDSFTFNLIHYLRELEQEVRVARADEARAADAMATGADAFLISPGPGTPEQARASADLVATCSLAKKPLLGVCLGHQVIACHYGASVVRADQVMHGKLSHIQHDGEGLFQGLPSPFAATRYNSLVIDRASVPDELAITATAEDGTIQGIAHRELPIMGVQFHPESIATEHGHDLLRNFLNMANLRSARQL
jgi:anthranilate synthase component 2